jgi:hypothetical protein
MDTRLGIIKNVRYIELNTLLAGASPTGQAADRRGYGGCRIRIVKAATPPYRRCEA